MRPEEDAYGQELWAYYKGRAVFEIVERDDGYISASTYPRIYFSDYEDWPLHEKDAMRFVKGKVLDIGCGAGRHSLYLQKKGFYVLGIDSSPLAIKLCKLRGLKKAEVMPLEDIAFKPNSFDTIIMMGGNFGLFGSFKKARRMLKRFHRMTSKNAMLIAETRDPYKTENPEHLEYHKFNKRRGRMSGQLRIRIRFGKHATRWFDYLLVSKEEMKEILRGTGWRIRKFLDSEGSQYIAIIEKGSLKTV
ncbi:MAG: class I SAM-dependent methyltransferase [Candidatus Bathyarchaeia archaeon]